MGDDRRVKDLEDRSKISAAVAAVAAAFAGGNATVALLPKPLTVVAGGVALAALIAVWRFAVDVRAARADAVQRELEVEREAREHDLAAAQARREGTIAVALRTPIRVLSDVALCEIGVDPVDPRVLARARCVEGDQLAYVRRDVDERLRGHLALARDGAGPRLVCLHGPSKAGKSRSMLEALRRELPNALLVAPDRARASLQAILDAGELQRVAAGTGRPVVLWLDDVETFVRIDDAGIDGRRLQDLERDVLGLVVAATSGGRGLRTHTDRERTQLQQPLSDLLAHGVREPLLAEFVTTAERAALGEVIADDLLSEAILGLGEVAVAGRELIHILVNASHPAVDSGRPCPEGAAVVWAAITAVRLGRTDPLSEGLLRELAGCYAHWISGETFRTGLRWATTPLYAHVALLGRQRSLVAAYDYVVQHAPRRDAPAERCAWTQLLDHSSPGELFQLGNAAYVRDRTDDAAIAWRRAADRGDARSAYNLGVLLKQRGDLKQAEAAYRRADDRGDQRGAYSLGVLLNQRGEPKQAEAAHRRADERGHAAAAHALGLLLEKRGELDEADAAYRRAACRGHGAAAWSLGLLLEERGELQAAHTAYERADKLGDSAGAFSFGVLLHARGEVLRAEAAFWIADARGHAEAAHCLGLLLRSRGELCSAEAAFRRADKGGDDAGAFSLGLMLHARGELQQAISVWRRAADSGDEDVAARARSALAAVGA